MADQAVVAVVFARTGTVEQRAGGISAFLVPMDLPGIATTRFEDSGQRAIGRGSIFFDNVAVPLSHCLGEEGKGFRQVMPGFDYSRALIGLLGLPGTHPSPGRVPGLRLRRSPTELLLAVAPSAWSGTSTSCAFRTRRTDVPVWCR